jgi:hypothetical protein
LLRFTHICLYSETNYLSWEQILTAVQRGAVALIRRFAAIGAMFYMLRPPFAAQLGLKPLIYFA